MTGKELVLNALKNREVERTPWVPFVGVHGGKLLGITATKYLQSGERIAEGLLKAVELYKPDGLPVLFDLQLEAEQLGCEMRWGDKLPPSVASHPLEKVSLDELPEYRTDSGRFIEVQTAISLVKPKVADSIALYGLITGPFTLALHLYGNNIFLDMLMNPTKIKDVLEFCTDIAIETTKFYVENGMDVIAVVDPMTSQISPEHFTEFVTPYVDKVFDYIKESGLLSSLFVCGNATRNLEVMCKTSCDNISIDENISLEYLKELSEKHNKSFGGNLQLTKILLFGTELQSQQNAIECLEIGGTKGFILAPGCDLPFDCPEKNLIAVTEVARDSYKRDIAKALIKDMQDENEQLPDLEDYANYDKVLVEVVTLDSGSCPPCFYMVDAVKNAIHGLEDKVEIREYKISTKEGLLMMKALNVHSIPTICINGEIAFSSIIPDSDKLRKKVEEYLR